MKIIKFESICHSSDKVPKHAIYSLDFQPDGDRLATAGGDSTVKLWSMRACMGTVDEALNGLLATIDGHTKSVNIVRWSRSGEYLASGGDDNLILLHKLSTSSGFITQTFGSKAKKNKENWITSYNLIGHYMDILDLDWNMKSQLASASIDNKIIIWSIPQSSPNNHSNNNHINNNIQQQPQRNYSLATKILPFKILEEHQSFVKGISFDPIGKYLISNSTDNSIIIWNTTTWTVTQKFQSFPSLSPHDTTIFRRMSWAPDGSAVCLSNCIKSEKPIGLALQRNSWEPVADLIGHEAMSTVCKFSPKLRYDNRYVNNKSNRKNKENANNSDNSNPSDNINANNSNNKMPTTADVTTNNQHDINHNHTHKSNNATASAASTLPHQPVVPGVSCTVAMGDNAGLVSIWTTDRSTPLAVIREAVTEAVTDISWTDTGNILAVSSLEGSVVIIDLTVELQDSLSAEDTVAHFTGLYGRSQEAIAQPTVALVEDPIALQYQLQQRKQQQRPIDSSSTSTSRSVLGDSRFQSGVPAVTLPFPQPVSALNSAGAGSGVDPNLTSSASTLQPPSSVLGKGTDRSAASGTDGVSSGGGGGVVDSNLTGEAVLDRQILTQTKSGKKRIQPVLLQSPEKPVVDHVSGNNDYSGYSGSPQQDRDSGLIQNNQEYIGSNHHNISEVEGPTSKIGSHNVTSRLGSASGTMQKTHGHKSSVPPYSTHNHFTANQSNFPSQILPQQQQSQLTMSVTIHDSDIICTLPAPALASAPTQPVSSFVRQSFNSPPQPSSRGNFNNIDNRNYDSGGSSRQSGLLSSLLPPFLSAGNSDSSGNQSLFRMVRCTPLLKPKAVTDHSRLSMSGTSLTTVALLSPQHLSSSADGAGYGQDSATGSSVRGGSGLSSLWESHLAGEALCCCAVESANRTPTSRRPDSGSVWGDTEEVHPGVPMQPAGIAVVGCRDGSLHVLHLSSGVRLVPVMVLGGPVCFVDAVEIVDDVEVEDSSDLEKFPSNYFGRDHSYDRPTPATSYADQNNRTATANTYSNTDNDNNNNNNTSNGNTKSSRNGNMSMDVEDIFDQNTNTRLTHRGRKRPYSSIHRNNNNTFATPPVNNLRKEVKRRLLFMACTVLGEVSVWEVDGRMVGNGGERVLFGGGRGSCRVDVKTNLRSLITSIGFQQRVNDGNTNNNSTSNNNRDDVPSLALRNSSGKDKNTSNNSSSDNDQAVAIERCFLTDGGDLTVCARNRGGGGGGGHWQAFSYDPMLECWIRIADMRFLMSRYFMSPPASQHTNPATNIVNLLQEEAVRASGFSLRDVAGIARANLASGDWAGQGVSGDSSANSVQIWQAVTTLCHVEDKLSVAFFTGNIAEIKNWFSRWITTCAQCKLESKMRWIANQLMAAAYSSQPVPETEHEKIWNDEDDEDRQEVNMCNGNSNRRQQGNSSARQVVRGKHKNSLWKELLEGVFLDSLGRSGCCQSLLVELTEAVSHLRDSNSF